MSSEPNREVTFRFRDGLEVKFEVASVIVNAAKGGSATARRLIDEQARKVRAQKMAASVLATFDKMTPRKVVLCPLCRKQRLLSTIGKHIDEHRPDLERLAEVG